MSGLADRPNAAAVVWRCVAFDGLSVHGLYGLLRLRSEVFVVEQHCVFQDMDGLDPDCLHLLGEGVLVQRGVATHCRQERDRQRRVANPHCDRLLFHCL